MKNSYATIVNKLSVFKLFHVLFSQHAYSMYKVRKPRMTKFGQGVEVRAHYPSHKVVQALIAARHFIHIYSRTPCPNLVIYKISIFAGEKQFCNNSEWTVSFQIVSAIIFVQHDNSICKVRKPRMTKLGHANLRIKLSRHFIHMNSIPANRVVCPNFGHPALTQSFTKYQFLQVKNSFAIIVNGLSVFKLFQLFNGDILFSQHAYSIYKVRKPRITKLGHANLRIKLCRHFIHMNSIPASRVVCPNFGHPATTS